MLLNFKYSYYLLILVRTAIANTILMEEVKSFADKVDTSTDTVLQSPFVVESAIECANICARNDKCLSFFFESIDGVCLPLKNVLTELKDPAKKVGSKYYKKKIKPVPELPLCSKGWIHIYESCVFFSGLDLQIWESSKQSCLDMGANLLELETIEERQAVEEYIENNGVESRDIYIGATDMEEEGTYVWYTTGEKVQYQHWVPGQPSDSLHEENCVVISWGWMLVTEWDDFGCHRPTQYACEMGTNV